MYFCNLNLKLNKKMDTNLTSAVKSVISIKSIGIIALTMVVVILLSRWFTQEKLVENTNGELEIQRSFKMPRVSMN